MSTEFTPTAGLVSVIIPCYNGEPFLGNQLDSILAQDYPLMELVIVNDGSTDGTLGVMKSYLSKFKSRGWRCEIVDQPNSGQASAVNRALTMINGQYLVWPDADDYYSSPRAISIMVEALEAAPGKVGMVRTHNRMVKYSDHSEITVRGAGRSGIENRRELFEDCLFAQNRFYFSPGAYMIRTADFFNCSEMPISTPRRGGQNWQLFLPILYNFNLLTIPQILYTTVYRGDSHSNSNHGYEGNIARIESYERTVCETIGKIKAMPSDEREDYIQRVHAQYAVKRYWIAYEAREWSRVVDFYRQMRGYGDSMEWKITARTILAWLRSKASLK